VLGHDYVGLQTAVNAAADTDVISIGAGNCSSGKVS